MKRSSPRAGSARSEPSPLADRPIGSRALATGEVAHVASAGRVADRIDEILKGVRREGLWSMSALGNRQRISRRFRTGGFRSAHLNFVGWTAVLVPGLVLGLIAGWLGHLSLLLFAVGGIALSWLIALVVDHLAWLKISFGVSNSDLTVDEARSAVARLRRKGVEVDLEVVVDLDGGEPAWTVRSTNRFRKSVYEALGLMPYHWPHLER